MRAWLAVYWPAVLLVWGILSIVVCTLFGAWVTANDDDMGYEEERVRNDNLPPAA